MQKIRYITILFSLLFFSGFSQQSVNRAVFDIKGSVKGKENGTPIVGVKISSDKGRYTTTDTWGEYTIKASIGDRLTFESLEIETYRHDVVQDVDRVLDILVEGYVDTSFKKKNKQERSKFSKRKASLHQSYLDSANTYKKTDIKKSIDFIAQSIADLGKRGNKKSLSKSLTTLGEVYQYHGQYDLAIANFKDALNAQKSTPVSLQLGKTYLLNKDYTNAESHFLSLIKEKRMTLHEKVQLYEGLGDAYKGNGDTNKAVEQYNIALGIAKDNTKEREKETDKLGSESGFVLSAGATIENLMTSKITDLNSKIADAYAKDKQWLEAQGYFANSLKLADQEAPQRAIQEKEKVADFYNQRSQFDDEIQLRKENLDKLKLLPNPVLEKKEESKIENDTITAQRINYKIANAYISQDKYDEAIPYLEESINEADVKNDLVVQKDGLRKLSEVYEYKGDFTKAYETYRAYAAVVDTLYIRKEQELSQAGRFNREIASKQSRITGLEQERQLSQSKYELALTSEQLVLESNKLQEWVIYSLIVALLLIGLAAFFFYRSNRQQKLANNLLALKSLRSQMNPHFIFNALNSVNNYIAKSDERSANRYLSDFSTLMRAVLENSEEDFIPLSKELELLELYTKLEHSRFPDKFDYTIHIDEHIDVDAFQIPPMLLQPYIENAIWHGLRYKETKGFLKIDLEQKEKGALSITIVDNGIGRKKSAALKTSNQKKRKSKGMGNIKKRVAILNDMYKDKVDVHISDLENGGTGTKVVFILKKE